MHIGIISLGTRGDAQPYIAVGRQLQELGHRVTLITNDDHRVLTEDHGLGFRPVCGSFRKLLESPEGVEWLASSDSPGRYVRAFGDLFGPLAYDWVTAVHDAVGDLDAALVHSTTVGGICAVQARGLPFVVVSPFPWVASRELRILGLPGPRWLVGWLEVALSGVAQRKLWQPLAKGAERYWRERGLPSQLNPWAHVLERQVPHLHLFSEAVIPRPSDWPACAEVTGFCFLDAPQDWQPDEALRAFLEAGPAPIYIGFGSMTGLAPEVLAALTRQALDETGQRAVIGMGWGGLAAFANSSDALIVHDVPHEWLFPRMAAVVHHGGAGTTAAALRAGRPNVIVPFFGDQPQWGHRVAEIGAGPPPILKRKLSASRLRDAIDRAVSRPAYAERAAEIAARIAAEDGARNTAVRALAALSDLGT